MNEGVNDRKYNLVMLVTKQVSRFMCLCIPTQMCAHGAWVRAPRAPTALALQLPHPPLPMIWAELRDGVKHRH